MSIFSSPASRTFYQSLLKLVFNSLRLEHCSKMEVTVDQHASSGCFYYMTGSTRCGPTSSAVGYSATSTTPFSLPTPLFSLANSSNGKQQYSLSSSNNNGTTKSSHLSLLNLNNSLSSSFSVNSAVNLPSPTLPQYTNLSDSGHASSMYSFEDYHGTAALPFPALNPGWSITNLDQANHHHHHNQFSGTGNNNSSLLPPPPPPPLTLKDIKGFSGNYPSKSALTGAELRIIKQPEMHHRARYMTEGSRGTVKDRTGRGYPVVQLVGYKGSSVPIRLQCFIGHDLKQGEPHLFYQACEVGSSKTAHSFTKIDGGGCNALELELLPKYGMQAVLDCLGILKERNVDVERKVMRSARRRCSSGNGGSIGNSKVLGMMTNEETAAKVIRSTNISNKSRSAHCRMVFRLILPETGEVLQAVSEPILCTQPLGSPEIHKMSATCEADLTREKVGGCLTTTTRRELFILGKNFHKDARVVFECPATRWRKEVLPQREFLNSTHLVCLVPPYDGLSLVVGGAITVDVSVHCGGKSSEPMKFAYTAAVDGLKPFD